MAARSGQDWYLHIIDEDAKATDFGDGFYTLKSKVQFADESDDCYVLNAFGRLHEEALYRGARVVPVWCTQEQADAYIKRQGFISRMLLKVRKLSKAKLLELAHQHGHNYLAINHSDLKREAVIVDSELILEKNTMQL